jgi:hypothetical protein
MKARNHIVIKTYQLRPSSFYQTKEIRETLISSVAVVVAVVVVAMIAVLNLCQGPKRRDSLKRTRI